MEPEHPRQRSDSRLRGLLWLLGLSFTALCNSLFSLRTALLCLLPLFVAIAFGNALAHVFWLCSFRTYAPGVVTSSLLVIPLTLLLVRDVLRAGLVPRAYVWVLLAAAALQPTAAAVAGGTLPEGALALQRQGARLATWLGSAL